MRNTIVGLFALNHNMLTLSALGPANKGEFTCK
ncbi:hypothetical protein SHLI107390_08430 [Shewanella livingstonensis]